MLVRSEQREAALVELQTAVGLQPDESRFVYVYAVGLNSMGRGDEAIAVLQEATKRFPADFDLYWALATMLRDQGRLNERSKRSRNESVADLSADRARPEIAAIFIDEIGDGPRLRRHSPGAAVVDQLQPYDKQHCIGKLEKELIGHAIVEPYADARCRRERAAPAPAMSSGYSRQTGPARCMVRV